MEEVPPLHPLSLNYATMYNLFLGLIADEAAISTSDPVSKEQRLGSMSHPALLCYYGQVLYCISLFLRSFTSRELAA